MLFKRLAIFICLLGTVGMLPANDQEITRAVQACDSGKHTEAFRLLQELESGNDDRVLAYLGRCYYNGWGVAQDKIKAFQYFQRAAQMGNGYALNVLGLYYEHGIFVEENKEKAIELYRKAIEKDCTPAYVNLGGIYFSEGKFEEALPLFIKASAEKSPDSFYFLAVIFENGLGVKMDLAKALFYAEQFGNLTENWALYADICYGIGLENYLRGNKEKAKEYLKKSADKDKTDALYMMGCLAAGDLQYDYFLQAARQGDRRAYMHAGYYLAQEKKEFAEAMKYYLAAAEDGDTVAMCELGTMYRLGEGVPADYDKAMEWYEKAAALYDPRALRELAVKNNILYNINASQEKYLSRYYALFALAAFLGDEIALKNLPSMLSYAKTLDLPPKNSDLELAVGLLCFLQDEDPQYAKGICLLKQSALQGNVDAQNILGKIHLGDVPKNISAIQDKHAAATYFRQAAKAGSLYAQRMFAYNTGLAEVTTEEEKFAQMTALAATGDKIARHNLASYYESKGNLKKAEMIYLENAKAGDANSQHRIFNMSYAKKIQISPDEALNFLDMAVAQHLGDAEYTEGMMRGFLAERHREAAVLFMDAMMDGTRFDVFAELANSYMAGAGVEKDVEFAIKLYNTGVERGFGESCFYLGGHYRNGNSIPVNRKKAMELFKRGADLGHVYCREQLREMEEEQQ